jgi:alpha-glucosidase
LQSQALLLSLRGTIIIYQGQELGLPEACIAREDIRDILGKKLYPRGQGRDGERTPMPWEAEAPHAGFSMTAPWLPVDQDHYPLAVDRQEKDETSALNFTRRFIRWRKDAGVDGGADMRFIKEKEPFLIFERQGRIFAFNLSPSAASLKNDSFEKCDAIVPGGLRPDIRDGTAAFPPYGFFISKA